ncbi:MAG: hypothetical protein OXU29_04715 [Gammaproteobacteria bacterium]|nr:hypothetical protein [Gammaproteobacteria bacterium]MDD9799745.1 hypothetical protein [Gammaproteobacteria bacterium]MDD9870030.1 hypothetical protein [Gammaproteobacteria bacterium]
MKKTAPGGGVRADNATVSRLLQVIFGGIVRVPAEVDAGNLSIFPHRKTTHAGRPLAQY